MVKRVGMVSLLIVVIVVGIVAGKKIYKRMTAARPSETPPQVQVDPTQTETFPVEHRSRVQVVAPAKECSTEWTQFLGPGCRGHSPCQPPLQWSETTNVVWKIAMPGKGHSSPLIKQEQIWLTCAEELGQSLQVLCIDARTGAILRQKEVLHCDKPPVLAKTHTRQYSHAASTPTLVGDKLFVHFPHAGTACLSTTSGEILWTNYDVYADGPGGSTPTVCESRLIIPIDGESEQYLAALDCDTGRLLWKTPRDAVPLSSTRRAYSTPVVVGVDGHIQVISVFADRACSYDPATGREIWHIDYRGYGNIPRPAVSDGSLFICTGFDGLQLWAVQAGGSGDVTNTHVKWKVKRNVPLIASPLVVGSEIYIATDKGQLSCIDAPTGEILWTERLQGGFFRIAAFRWRQNLSLQ